MKSKQKENVEGLKEKVNRMNNKIYNRNTRDKRTGYLKAIIEKEAKMRKRCINLVR